MSEVTFTPEQIREIRHRICTTQPGRVDVSRDAILRCFPLSKVTRYRTFTHSMGGVSGAYEMRVRDGVVEYETMNGWVPNTLTSSGDALVASWAASLARSRDWAVLAALADICQRPTEEVDP